MQIKNQNISLATAINLSVALLILSGSFLQNLFAQKIEDRLTQEERRLFNRDKYDPQYLNMFENTSIAKPADTGDSMNVRLVGRWANGPCQAVAIQDSIAYFGNGAYLEIVDFSDPGNHIELGQLLLPELPFKIAVSDNYVYVTISQTGLQVIDATNPANPHKVGFIATNGWAYGVTVNENYLYLADGGGGLRIFDVTDPTNPNEIGNLQGDSPCAVKVRGNYAYLADGSASLRIIDISDPSNPSEVGVANRGKDSDGVAVSGNYAYVIASYDSMRVIDVSNPSNPVEVGLYRTGNGASSIDIKDNYVYVVGAECGFRVIDINNPYNPVEVGFFMTRGYPEDIVITGNYAYVADWHNGIRIIDISTSANLREAGFFNTGDYTLDVSVNNDYAYVSTVSSGIQILNISNPSNPIREGKFNAEEGDAREVDFKDKYAYVADGWAGLRVVDIANPQNPTEVGFYNTVRYASGVCIKDNLAYVAMIYGGGLAVIDISNPMNPTEIGFFDTDTIYWTNKVTVSGNYVYIAAMDSGLRILDVSNPANPQEIGTYITEGYSMGLAMEGSYIYLANGFNGLRVIDVSNPTSPSEIGFFQSAGEYRDVVIDGNYAYVSVSSKGLLVLDIINPSNPIEVGFYDTAEHAFGVTVNSDHIYIADGVDGLYIFEYIGPISGKPGTPILSQPANNSFTNDNTPELTWNIPADNDGDLLHFKVEISSDNDFINHILGSPFESQNNTSGFDPTPPVAESDGQCHFTPSNSLNEGNYWWRVTAWDGQEYSNPSSSRKFTVDTSPPYTSDHNPAPNEINVPIITNIIVHVQDSISGMNQSSIVMKVNDTIVTPDITGTTSNYTLTYDPATNFEYSQQITVSIDVEDNAGNSMETESYSFFTESIDMVNTPAIPTGSVSAKVGQSVVFTTGGSRGDPGQQVQYRFDWGDGNISAWGDTIQSHIYLRAGTYNIKSQARFSPDTMMVSAWSSGIDVIISGHQLDITVNGSGNVIIEPDKSEYNHDEKVQLTAVASSGYEFDRWEGSLSGKNNPDSVTMASDMAVLAYFTEVIETVRVLPNPFTPNNDGYNDYVSFKYPEMETREAIVRIFNLRGRKVKELKIFSGNEYRWYGKDENDRQLEPGVYLYILEVDSKTIASGTITLIK